LNIFCDSWLIQESDGWSSWHGACSLHSSGFNSRHLTKIRGPILSPWREG
jgi:hypothetical protein